MTNSFHLGKGLIPEQIAPVFRKFRRIHIPGIFKAGTAQAIYEHLSQSKDWALVFNNGDKVYDLDKTAQSAMSSEQRDKLITGLHDNAQQGFQFLFESIRVSDLAADRAANPTLLNQLCDFLNSEPFLAFVRQATGFTDINFVDAQATAYGPGHFLTNHDDNVAGKNRRAAYVLNFTPQWRPDWGGLLQFIDSDNHIAEAYTPKFNALNIFAVPQPHAVSYVTPFAGAKRYSVTGWLRAL